MIHSGQIPSPFLADKVLQVAGNVYRETWKEPKGGEDGNTCGAGREEVRCVELRGVSEGKV
jgi:hypothetical protein